LVSYKRPVEPDGICPIICHPRLRTTGHLGNIVPLEFPTGS
jgi:hypothetical protein